MGKRLAAVQSCYIPWKGYFDLIRAVDEFVLYDDAQFTRRDWRNRNRIKTKDGTRWLTIPVAVKGQYHAPINEIRVADPTWGPRHWRQLTLSYRKTPGFPRLAERFEAIYLGDCDERLSFINRRFIEEVCAILGIRTRLSWSMDYTLKTGRNQRLIDLCIQAGARTYVSGPSARSYLDLELFRQSGLEVVFLDYAGYPCYEQPFPPFEHTVSIVDLLFCTGPDAPRYLLTF
jgi:WbqC-like protein family